MFKHRCRSFSPFYISFYCIFSLLFLINSEIVAGDNPSKKRDNWSVSLSLSPYYDSNILKYSNKYIERFKNGEDEGRFHIHSIDDLTFGYSFGLTYANEIVGKLKTILGAGFDSDAYTYNSIKSWFTYDIFLRQYLSKSTSFYVSYSYIPKFYVRHFRDEDWVKYYGYVPETFQPYEFSKDDYSVWLHHTFSWKTTRARAYFSYDRYFLNPSNTEYDSNDFLYGLKIYQSLTDKLDVSAAYYYITSDAKGYDEPGETKATSDDSDATNYEHVYAIGFDYQMPKIFKLKNEVSIDAQYQRAFYTTDHFLELDPLHAGRYDYNYRVFVNYNWDVLKNFSITAFYQWMKRESSTSAEANKEYVSDEKDYTQYRIGVRFNYSINF
jgi:hypothetical protein